MPIKKDTTDADIAAFEKWAGKATASEGKTAPAAPAEAAPSKPITSPNVSGIPDPAGDWARGGLENFMTSHPVGRAPTDEEMDWQQRAGRGVAKGLAGDVVGARSVAGRMLPSLNPLLASVPETAPLKRAYRAMKEFSGRPDTSTAESLGRVGGGQLPFAFAPYGKGAEVVENAMMSLPVRGGFAQGTPEYIAQAIRQAKQATAAGYVTRGVEGAAIGGAAGAVQSPEDPEAGAVPGMIAGAVNPVASGLFRSKFGQWLGGIGLTEALYKGLNWASGNRVPYYPVGVSIVWHSSPFGRKLRVAGNRITDEAGRLIGNIPPGLLGTAAGQALGGGTSDEQ